MKRKFSSMWRVTIALVMVLSLGLVMAAPVAAVEPPVEPPPEPLPEQVLEVVPFELGDQNDAEATAEWSTVDKYDGSSSVHLVTGLKDTPPDWGDGDEGRIVIDASDVGISTLGEIISISWYVSTKLGYSPHIDITLDVADESADMLTAELACNNDSYTHPPVAGADEWRQTFEMAIGDGYDAIGSDTILWVTGMGAGTADAPFGTLADWQAGIVANDPAEEFPEGVVINSDTPVLKFEIEIDNWIVVSEAYIDDITINDTIYYGSIQDAIDSAIADAIINVAAGTYDEQVVIDKPLTLQGTGDTTIIQPSELVATPDIPWIGATANPMAAIVSVETAGDEVTIRDLKIDASLIITKPTLWLGGLVYLETSGTIENLTVTINSALPDRTAGIFAAAIDYPTFLEVAECNVIGYNRAGIYALGAQFTADYHHNEINGPGSIPTGVPNGMFFLEGAKGSATYNTVTDLFYTGEEYRSTGIGTFGAGTPITFAYNTISNVQNAFALSNSTSGTIVEYNDIFNNHTGVRLESGAQNSIIRYNDIHDNDFAIRCESEVVSGMGPGNVAHYNNFVDNPGLAWINTEGGDPYTYEGAVCNLSTVYTLDATNNWWGSASGPKHVGSWGEPPIANPLGLGDAVSDDVIYNPWLLVADGATYDKTLALNAGWSIVSPAAELNSPTEADPRVAYSIADSTVVYAYDNGGFAEATSLDPITPVFVKTTAGGGVGFNYAEDSMGIFTTNLEAGWNLIGVPHTNATADAILSPIRLNSTGDPALATLVSQGNYNLSDIPSFYISILTQDWPPAVPELLSPFDGYWAYMNVAKEFGVVVVPLVDPPPTQE